MGLDTNTKVRPIHFGSLIHDLEEGEKGMIKAKDIMTKELITVSPKTEITKAAKILLEKGINGVPVVEGGQLVGIVGKEDVLRTLMSSGGG